MLNLAADQPCTSEHQSHTPSAEKCDICLHYRAKYKCPKCLIGYCSSKCYNAKLSPQNQHAKCREMFTRDNVSQELKSKQSQKRQSMIQMQKILRRVNNLDEEQKVPEISDERLTQILEAIEAGKVDQICLGEREQSLFTAFVKSQQINDFNLPFWKLMKPKFEPSSKLEQEKIDSLCHIQTMSLDIQDLDQKKPEVSSLNLNSMVFSSQELEEHLSEVESDHETIDNSEFIDLDEEEMEASSPNWTEKVFQYFEVLRSRYQTTIPGDISKLLNRGPKVGKVREPSALVQYLIFSNSASFVFYYRLWNCSMAICDGESDEGIPFEEALSIC